MRPSKVVRHSVRATAGSGPPVHRVGKQDDNGDGGDPEEAGDYTGDVTLLEPPPPSPPTSPPKPDSYLVGGGMTVKLTGDEWTDEHNRALVDQVRVIHEYWLPAICAGVALCLFLLHNLFLNLGVQGKDSCLSEDSRRIANVLSCAAAYMLCSFTNIIFNKLILRSIPLPAFVAAVQMGASVITLLVVNGAIAALVHSCTPASKADATCCPKGAICSPEASCGLKICGTRRWKGISIGSRHDLWKWIPAAMLHSAAYLLLLEALHRTSVSNVMVWRQLSPLPTMIVERLLSNAVYRTSCSAFLGLGMIITGVILYSVGDLLYDWLGMAFAVLSMLMMVWEGLLKRHLLTNSKDPPVLSLQAMIFLNNAVGFCLAMILVLSYELWLFGYKAIPHIRRDEIIYTLCAAFLTSLYHYMGLQLAKAVSASYVLCSTFLAKIAIVVFAALCLGDATSSVCLVGLCLALGGNLLYLLSRLQVMRAQELADQKIREDDGTDICDNIRGTRKSGVDAASDAPPANPWWLFGWGGGDADAKGNAKSSGVKSP